MYMSLTGGVADFSSVSVALLELTVLSSKRKNSSLVIIAYKFCCDQILHAQQPFLPLMRASPQKGGVAASAEY